MKKFRLALSISLCVLSTLAVTACGKSKKVKTPKLEGYNLLWADEFNDSKLDFKNSWNYEPHDPGWTNEELQEYTTSTDNVFVEDGKVVIKANKTEKNGEDYYTSGKITTQHKVDFMYGKVVARAKAPEGQGLWPAIWMMPTEESKYGQWPLCGEIDIMEVLGHETSKAYCTLHYGSPHGEQQGIKTLTEGSFSSDFHDYSIEWEPGEIRWYIDDELILTANDWFTGTSGEENYPYPAPFNQTFFIQLNLAVGGTWPGNPDETTNFDNARFECDYVRVYQKDSYDTNVSRPAQQFRSPDANGEYVQGDIKVNTEEITTSGTIFNGWTFYTDGGKGSAQCVDGKIVIKTTTAGDKDYSIQIFQTDMPVLKGHKYKISFDAYADEERTMKTCISAPNNGWMRYFPANDDDTNDKVINLKTTEEHYEFEFTMNSRDDGGARIEFNMGNQGSTATIYITNISFKEVK